MSMTSSRFEYYAILMKIVGEIHYQMVRMNPEIVDKCADDVLNCTEDEKVIFTECTKINNKSCEW